jgi:hypothetical protein
MAIKHSVGDLRGNDIIDSRDVIARIAELEGFRDDAIERAKELRESTDEDAAADIWQDEDGTEYGVTDDWDESTEEEYRALTSLESEAEGYCSDWRHGATLIADSYFEEYAEQLAEDIGAIDPNARWPLNHIDWVAAANELKQDYTSVDFDGTEYWVRQ